MNDLQVNPDDPSKIQPNPSPFRKEILYPARKELAKSIARFLVAKAAHLITAMMGESPTAVKRNVSISLINNCDRATS
jgi:hypothetical protein